MATIYVDNKPFEIPDGQNLLNACLSLGFNLPYFCWHPALGSVGACRLCAVKQFRDENDTRGRIVMACMTPATNGTRISIEDAEAHEMRASVIEWLMLNHPHDCPVCDEGGECHLQDMTVMTGHNYREYRFKKRTFKNQYLGPFVHHEMNRCIECYRCVRFYRDYANGHDLDVFAAHDAVYFGRYEDGILESEFSGNLVEVCPTGVFTDETLFRHYTRKWDQQTAPSVCVNCGVGCNTLPGERYGLLRRIRNRFNSQVNGYFLCDRGRYGYEFVNSDRRIREPVYPGSTEETVPAAGPDAASALLGHVGELLAGDAKVIGIGSPRASLESNFALRTLVGPDRFYTGLAEQENRLVAQILHILQTGPARTPSQQDIRECDAILVLGEDLTNTAPMLALALRQSVRQQPMQDSDKLKIPRWDDQAVRELIQNRHGPLFIATPTATRLDDVATATYNAAPDDLARLGFAIGHALGGAPPVETVTDKVQDALGDVAEKVGLPGPEPAGLPDDVRDLARAIAGALKGAKRPLVVSGISLGSEALVQAAANVAWALRAAGLPAELSYVVPEPNTLGAGMMGGGSLEAAFAAVRDGTADTVVILENDLVRRADAADVDAFLDAAKSVIVLDYYTNATTAKADVVLPAATFAEGDGTFVNHEGRAQRFYQVFVPGGGLLPTWIQESWRWLRDLAAGAGRGQAETWRNLDECSAAVAGSLPIFKPILDIAPPAQFRMAGQKIARQTQRVTGRTAIWANITVHEPAPPADPDSPLRFSMEGVSPNPPRIPPPALITNFWAPGWNSIQSLNKFQAEVGGPLVGGDPGQRLIEPGQGGQPDFFKDVPDAFKARDGEWLVVPLYHIYGSEELSIMAPGVAERAPHPYLGLNQEDAARLGLSDGQELELPLGGVTRQVAVRIIPSLQPGVAGMPAGLPGMLGIALPARSRLGKG